MSLDMIVNRLPAPTWNWLHMNEASVKGVFAPDEGRIEAETPDTVEEYKQTGPELLKIATGMGSDMDELAKQVGGEFRIWKTAAGIKEAAPVRLHFAYEMDRAVQNRIGIYAEENSEITMIMDFRNIQAKVEQNKGLAAIQTRIRAAKGAKVRLVQVQTLSDGFTFLNDVGISCDGDSQIETIQLVLGGSENYIGLRSDLSGARSCMSSSIGYLLEDSAKLDMNYIAYHSGKKTTSHIDVSGVLRDQASKLFRGTIDFRNGAVGAKGDEKEDVLLLSDNVINRTIPLILCEEEDVEGNHGATIGRLDESLLFYLTSRGIEEADVYEIMAKARIDAVCKEIPDEKTQRLVQSYLGRDGEE